MKPVTIVWLLGASQNIGYGTLFYSFAILAGDIAAEFALPVSWIFGSFSLALLASGFIAALAGRRMDRHGAASVMAVGSAAAGVALVLAALAPGPISFTVALVVVETAGALVWYDAAFAALVQLTGTEARRRITQLTLIAGFASTMFWPLTTWLHGVTDWRTVLLLYAGLNLVVALPIHLLLARIGGANTALVPDLGGGPAVTPDRVLPPAVARRVLWLVTIGFALSGFMLSAVLTQMVPMLTALGLGAAALGVSTLFGPAQVLVRFVNMVFGVGLHPLAVAIVALTLLPAAMFILTASAPLTLGAAAFAVLLGFGSGLKSIVQGTLPLALFGSASYGARLGRMAAWRYVLAAIAPFVFAFLIDTAGPRAALGAMILVGLAGTAALVEVARIRKRHAGSHADGGVGN